MPKFIVEIKENNSNIESSIKSNDAKYTRELIINKNDSKFLELNACIKNFVCWYLGDKFAEVKTIDSTSFEVIKINN